MDGAGREQVSVVYPKFKNGEATVKNIKVEQNFGKVTVHFRASLLSDGGGSDHTLEILMWTKLCEPQTIAQLTSYFFLCMHTQSLSCHRLC